MDENKLTPALIGGCTFGVLASLPYVAYLNMVCCALYIGGGVLSAYLYLRERPPTPSAPYRDGAVVGLLAGLFGGVAATVVSLVVTMAGMGQDIEAAKAAMEQMGQTGYEPPEWLLEVLGFYGVTPLMAAAKLASTCISYAIAACIGGALGVAILHKKEG